MNQVSWPDAGLTTLSDGDEVRVVREAVDLGGDLGIVDIERPEDPPSLLQGWCDLADPQVPIPFWAEIWAASRAIARRLAAGASLAGVDVLDLGCGLGLCGIAAGLRGGTVTFADHHPDALDFAMRNASAAGLSRAEFRLVDWREPIWAHPFGLVLGADVIYDRIEHEAIAELLELLLSGGGTAWLGDPCRELAERFLADWVGRGGLATTVRVEPFPGEEAHAKIHDLKTKRAAS
jgi:2-polyprenyl-3-methyl-5-hydroxy-6-metoxy-1,4-benzoquinol methylase